MSDETDFKPALAATLFFWTIALLLVFVFAWMALSKVDERVRGAGEVMPASDIQVVQSLEGGILRELLATEGATVQKDQILMRLDNIRFASEGRGIEAQMAALQAKQARLKAEINGTPFLADAALKAKYPDIAANEEKLYTSRESELKTALSIIAAEVEEAMANLAETRANIGKFSRSSGLLRKELEITRKLVASKAQPEIEKIKLERELNDIEGNLATARQTEQSLEARLRLTREKEAEKKSAIRSQALGELNEVETKIAGIKETLNTTEDKLRRTELRAPAAGIVHKIHLKTIGGIVEPAAKVIEIVPADNDLVIRARVNPTDVAFLKTGQKARISISAYDPQIYGTLEGTLERVSADTVEDKQGGIFFEIDVKTAKNHLGTETEPLPIRTGMQSDVEIIVGKRTILSYLLNPVIRAKDRAFTEK